MHLTQIKRSESVKRTFPNSKIYREPELKYTFLVIDSLGVCKVTTTNLFDMHINGIGEYEMVK